MNNIVRAMRGEEGVCQGYEGGGRGMVGL